MFPAPGLDVSRSRLPGSWRCSEVCGGLAEPLALLVFGAALSLDSEIWLHQTRRHPRVAQTGANATIQISSPVRPLPHRQPMMVYLKVGNI